jgi:hypothetical protein
MTNFGCQPSKPFFPPSAPPRLFDFAWLGVVSPSMFLSINWFSKLRIYSLAFVKNNMARGSSIQIPKFCASIKQSGSTTVSLNEVITPSYPFQILISCLPIAAYLDDIYMHI